MSRPLTHVLGKNTERVETAIDGDTKDALTAMAWAAGMNLSQYLRDLLLAHVHGHTLLLRMAQRGAAGARGIEGDGPEMSA